MELALNTNMFLKDSQKFDSNVLHKTPEGYLQGRICVTGAGVFRYLADDGKIVGRLRDVEDVKKATDSLNGKPVTLMHPSDEVKPENAKQLSVGMSATDASFDGLNNFVTITITDKNAIKAVENGDVKAISCGYTCDVTDNVGVWQGSSHQQKQTGIAYNHIALVKEGRAGDQVRFHIGDSAEFFEMFKNQNKEEQPMKTINLDGVDYQADEAVVKALQDARAELAQAQSDLETMNNDNDKLREKLEEMELESELGEDEEDFESNLQDAIDAKLEVLDIARGCGCEVSTKDSVEDMYRMVIDKAFGEVDLEGKDASYLTAMFDAACVKLSENVENNRRVTSELDEFGEHAFQNDDAHDLMMDELFNIGKKKED